MNSANFRGFTQKLYGWFQFNDEIYISFSRVDGFEDAFDTGNLRLSSKVTMSRLSLNYHILIRDTNLWKSWVTHMSINQLSDFSSQTKLKMPARFTS